MAQESGQSHFPPPHFPISSSASPSSSEHDSLFSPPPANSAITTPSVTPDRDLVRPGATGQSNQKLAVERVDAPPESSQHEEPQPQLQLQLQHYTLTHPPTQSTRFRPYPPEMYAQGHAPSVYAPSQAYPTVPYTYVQAVAPPQGPTPQVSTAVGYPAQAGGMMHAFPTADAAYFYNLGLMHSLGAAQPTANGGQPVIHPPAPQQQQYPQMQGYVSTGIYPAMGQQMVSYNAGSVQQAAPAASSSVRSKRKRRMSNDGAANARRTKNRRPPVETYADLKNVGSNEHPLYECQRPQCKRLRMKPESVYNHLRTTIHAGTEYRLPCPLCGESLSRIDGLKRHRISPRCARNREAILQRTSGPSANAQMITPAPVVAADISIATPKMAEEEDLFGSPETWVALPADAAAQENTADAVASIPGFDATAYDISFDDWMNQAERAAPAVFADPTVDFSAFFGN